jgi:hypothetical protein
LKGGYWFIREKYRNEIAAAIARDKEKAEETRRELELEQRERRHAASRIQSRQSSPQPIVFAPAPARRGGHPPPLFDPSAEDPSSQPFRPPTSPGRRPWRRH